GQLCRVEAAPHSRAWSGVVRLDPGATAIADSPTIRIATYNVHKCRGMDRRVDLERIARVIEDLDADVIAIQEILHGEGNNSQARFLSERLRYQCSFGENRVHR